MTDLERLARALSRCRLKRQGVDPDTMPFAGVDYEAVDDVTAILQELMAICAEDDDLALRPMLQAILSQEPSPWTIRWIR